MVLTPYVEVTLGKRCVDKLIVRLVYEDISKSFFRFVSLK